MNNKKRDSAFTYLNRLMDRKPKREQAQIRNMTENSGIK